MEQHFIKPCAECGGQRVEVYLSSSFMVYQDGHSFPVFPTKASKASKSYKASSVKVISCLSCGHISFYAEQPEKLAPNQ